MNLAVEKSFSRAASNYRSHAKAQAALGDWLEEWLPVERTGRVVEIGAGTGLFTERISDWPGGITATDISPAMCAAGGELLPQVDWQVMAAERPLAGPWAWIISSGMLQWLQAPDEVFATWRNCLVPGGRILAGLFAAESLPELRAVSGGCDPLVWRTPEVWRRSLMHAGLRIVRDDVMTQRIIYGSARGFLRTLHGVGAAPVRRFSVSRMRRLLQDYDAQFTEDGGVRATWTFYRFEAERPVG